VDLVPNPVAADDRRVVRAGSVAEMLRIHGDVAYREREGLRHSTAVRRESVVQAREVNRRSCFPHR